MTPINRCLDGETLAAWVDGGLTRNDAAMAEAHVSTCPRCQEIAGLIVKTTPVTRVDAPWWRRRAAWLVPVSVGVAAVGLLMIAPTNPTAPPARAPLDSAQDAATSAAPPVAPTAETKAAETKQERQRDQRANTAADATAAPAAAPPPAAALGRRAEEQLAQKSSAAAAAKQAISPDGALHWRITDRGTLERSTDGGTWQPVNVWVAATFTTVQAPEPRTAIVTTADGRQFRTADAGATWRLVPR